MKTQTKTVVITGAESTGKSTLTKWLSAYYKVPLINEIARDYVINLKRDYTYNDVKNIAKMQIEQLDLLQKSGHTYIFVDTWLIITKVWFEVVFNSVPRWIEDKIKSTKIDLFLVCDTDLPWIADPVRENGGKKRLLLQKHYIELIKEYGFKHKQISGTGHERFNNAVKVINKI